MKHAWRLLALLALAVACGSSGSSRANSADDMDDADDSEIDPNAGQGLPPPEGPSRQCMDETGAEVECESDEECAGCPGFYCGLDPEGSTRKKICIWGGKD